MHCDDLVFHSTYTFTHRVPHIHGQKSAHTHARAPCTQTNKRTHIETESLDSQSQSHTNTAVQSMRMIVSSLFDVYVLRFDLIAGYLARTRHTTFHLDQPNVFERNKNSFVTSKCDHLTMVQRIYRDFKCECQCARRPCSTYTDTSCSWCGCCS